MKRIPDGNGGFLTVNSVVNAVNAAFYSNITVQDIKELFADNDGQKIKNPLDGKSEIDFEEIKKIIGTSGDVTDKNWMWIFSLLLVFGFAGNNGGGDYWHGKYDALKEIVEFTSDEE